MKRLYQATLFGLATLVSPLELLADESKEDKKGRVEYVNKDDKGKIEDNNYKRTIKNNRLENKICNRIVFYGPMIVRERTYCLQW